MRSTELQPLPRQRPSVPAILIYSGLLTGLLYSLSFQLSADAPMRLGGERPASLEHAEISQSKIAAQISDASNGKNVALHFQMPDDFWQANASFFATAYFRAVYEMYPRRIYIGSDNRVINFPADLKDADQLPTAAWLRKRDVQGVFTFLPSESAGPKAVFFPCHDAAHL